MGTNSRSCNRVFFFLLSFLWKWLRSPSGLDNLPQPQHLTLRQTHCCGTASVWRSGQRCCTRPAHIMTRLSRCTSLLYVSMLAAWIPRLRLIAASAAELHHARPVLPRCRCVFSCVTALCSNGLVLIYSSRCYNNDKKVDWMCKISLLCFKKVVFWRLKRGRRREK